jgi:hypothetical protein
MIQKSPQITKRTQLIQPLLNWVTSSSLYALSYPKKRNEPKRQAKPVVPDSDPGSSI